MFSLFKRNTNVTVVVIAPDKLSGQIYFDQFKKTYSHAILAPATIRPRVISRVDRPPELNPDSHGIGQDIANTIQQYYQKGYRYFSVACNTATFYPYAKYAIKILNWRHIPAREITPKNILRITTTPKDPDSAFLLTNTQSVKITFQNQELPLFLGTYPLTHRLSYRGFCTLFKFKQPQAALLVQELIWRVKAIGGDNISTAPSIDHITDPQTLDSKAIDLGTILQKLHINRIILGCTELPYVFRRLTALSSDYQPQLIDTADLVSAIYKDLIPRIVH